jgi:hypothetical protein
MESSPGEVTLLLAKLTQGNPDAEAELIPLVYLVYKELRRIAGYYMRDERVSHTLQPTALVRIVELRYYGGLSVEEIAEALRVSPRTVKREWAMAKAWLQAELAGKAAL